MMTVFRLLFVCIFLFPQFAEARSLFWQDIKVRASLDVDGRLHVREQQTMVFSGNWNGGERSFHIRPGQKMKFESISRIDANGQDIPLVRGNLSLVDHWDHNGKTTIRWRSRLPSDPVFLNTSITYVLRYSLSHILIPDQEGYLLDHDFCFPDRTGVVKNFHLDLEFDPAWQHPPLSMIRHDIAPGKGAVLQQQLQFSGQTRPTVYKKQAPLPKAIPAPPPSPASNWFRVFLLLVLLGWILWKARVFVQWERSLDRFVGVLPTDIVDKQWLAKELFVHKPEVVGATWDKTTSTPEVAAVLARLVQEERMESWMEPYLIPFFNFPVPVLPPTLHLKLLQPRESFTGYEYKLIKGLFVEGSTTTDTKTIRTYYQKKRKTFDPVAKLHEPLRKQMQKLTASEASALDMVWVPTVFLAVVGFFLLLGNGFLHQEEFFPLQVAGMLCGVLFWVVGLINGISYRNTVLFLGWRLFALFFAVACIPVGFCVLLFFPVSSLLLFGLFCMAMAISNNIINISKSRESVEGLALRRKLATARKYFQRELAHEKPEIHDSWFPYLLAFGLGHKVDSWFRKYGANRGYRQSPGSSFTTHSGNSGGSFTGGGGAFGGGGASGSWSSAVGSLTASGGGSSSGGGGSGGSSGGGGGGGW